MASFEKTDYHAYNQKNGYGLSYAQLKMWVIRHQNGTAEQRQWIE